MQDWERPESLSSDRPYYLLSAATGGSDLAGSVTAALAAAAVAWQSTDSSVYTSYMEVAVQTYAFGKKFTGLCAPALACIPIHYTIRGPCCRPCHAYPLTLRPLGVRA